MNELKADILNLFNKVAAGEVSMLWATDEIIGKFKRWHKRKVNKLIPYDSSLIQDTSNWGFYVINIIQNKDKHFIELDNA